MQPPLHVPPPHHPNLPPESHVAIAIATAHTARRSPPCALWPFASATLWWQRNVAEICQKWGSYRGGEGRVQGAGG